MLAEQLQLTFRETARRWAAPLVDRIPDVSGLPRGRMVAVGAIASLLFHLLVLLVCLVAALVWPKHVERTAETPAAEEKPLEVQIMPRPNKEIAARPEPKRTELLNLRGLDAPEEKPEQADFEADRDMKAASEKPPTGLLPMPSQDGRTDLPGRDFATQEVRIGLAKPQPPPAPAAPAAPSVSPMYQPKPVAKEAIKAAENAKPIDQLPEPAKTLRATPPPLRISDQPDPNALPIARTTPPPKPVEMAKLTPTQPPPPSQPSAPSITSRYLENLQKTRVEGNVSNRGPNAMNVTNTPMGRYHRRMCQQIESIWQLKTRSQASMLNLSTVRVRYLVEPNGQVRNVEVLDDGGDRRHADICVQAVRALKLDPLPPEAEPMMNGGTLEMVFSFTLF